MSRYLDAFRSFKPLRQESGLDFSYIPMEGHPKQIGAMCEPARNPWSVLRNSPRAVEEFLRSNHGSHYVIYNLTEHPHPQETRDLFGCRVVHMPIPDHNPPRLYQILEFCLHANAFLKQDPRNCIVVHCKAGKGRTGTLVCAYLLYSREYVDADKALDWFARHRSQPSYVKVKDDSGRTHQVERFRGVDQASQVTSVKIFGKLLLQRPNLSLTWLETIQKVPRTLRCIIIHQLPSEYLREITVHLRSWGYKNPAGEQSGELLRLVRKYVLRPVAQFPNPVLVFTMKDIEVRGETKIEVRSGDSIVCRLWFHPYLQPLHGVSRTSKGNIDDAWKSSKFPRDFALELQFAPITAAELHELEIAAEEKPKMEPVEVKVPGSEFKGEGKQDDPSIESSDDQAQEFQDLLEQSSDPLAALKEKEGESDLILAAGALPSDEQF